MVRDPGWTQVLMQGKHLSVYISSALAVCQLLDVFQSICEQLGQFR